MSKELVALEYLMNACCNTCESEVCGAKKNEACLHFRNYKFIETALKRLEELEKPKTIFISNGRTMGATQKMFDDLAKIKPIMSFDLNTVKKLKALEAIKECFVLNGFDELIPNSKWFDDEEKQNLVKEVLKEGIAVKKKRIDLSIEELKNICHKKGQLCCYCPLFSKKIGTCIESYLRIRQLIDEDELNEEVEVLK